MSTDTMLGTDAEGIAKSRTFLDIELRRLAWQCDDVSDIDQKIGVWLQAAPVITGLLLGLLGTLKGGLNPYARIVASVAVACFLGALATLLRAQVPARFKRGTDWQDIADFVNDPDLPQSEFHYALAYYIGNETIPDNLAKIERKAVLFPWAVRGFAVASALLLVAALIALISPA